MATAFHQEALRKQRILERKQQAAARMEAERMGIFEPQPCQRAMPTGMNPPTQTDTCGSHSTKGMVAIQAYHRHARALHLPDDQVYAILHPRDYNFRVPVDKLPERKPHFKV